MISELLLNFPGPTCYVLLAWLSLATQSLLLWSTCGAVALLVAESVCSPAFAEDAYVFRSYVLQSLLGSYKIFLPVSDAPKARDNMMAEIFATVAIALTFFVLPIFIWLSLLLFRVADHVGYGSVSCSWFSCCAGLVKMCWVSDFPDGEMTEDI